MIHTFLVTLVTVLHLAPAWATPRDADDRTRPGVATLLPEVPQIAWSDLVRGDLIGHGSFGDVYAGSWKGQDVAIKVLQMRTLPNAQIKRDFDEEVRTLWTCQFPGVVRLRGVCTEPGHLAMVFERMHRSLHDRIHSGEEITEFNRLQIALDITQGLVNLHRQQVVHRDLKSHNILLNQRGRAKITDFGLARIRTATNTITAQAQGTVRWTAPELFGTTPRATAASDMYSYGMILWEILTRRTPFAAQPNDVMVVVAVAKGKREEIPDTCHPIWREVIETCWQADPRARPTAQGVLSKFMTLQPPSRPLWLPEEAPDLSTIRTEGYVCYPASRKDWEQVLRCYQDHPVPGHDVVSIEVVFNPSMNTRFQSQRQLLQQRRGNPRYLARWRNEPLGDEKANVLALLESAADPYFDEDYPDVTLVPVWHGTQKDKLPSLLSAGYGAFCDTDNGYFGKGIYTTLEAEYAQMYANQFSPIHMENGVLILNWGITYSSYPILKQNFDLINKKLAVSIQPGIYDSHFVPVVPGDPANPAVYIPIASSGEPHRFTEMVFMEAAQVLPRYVVTLQPSLPSQGFVMGNALREKDTEAKAKMEATERRVEKEAARKALEQLGIITQERDAFAQQKETLTQQLTLMKSEQDRGKREKDTLVQRNHDMAKEMEALRNQLRALEVTIPSWIKRPQDQETYMRFLRGKLIYTDPDSKERIALPFRDLANPLEGEFDLSRCGDSGKYLSINTGYRKGKRAANAYKIEIWIAPRFLIERNLNGNAAHFNRIMGEWDAGAAPVGLFSTWGGWDRLGDYNYLTTETLDDLAASSVVFYRSVRSITNTLPSLSNAVREYIYSTWLLTWRASYYLERYSSGISAFKFLL